MKNLFFCLLAFFSLNSLWAQNPTIAIANPNVSNLSTSPETASKYLRLELIKLEKYSVYDEFDMKEAYKTHPEFNDECLSKNCLINLGKVLKVDYIISGSFDLLANKIVISLKMIDVNNEKLHKTIVKEFDNQELELQRMTQIVIQELHDIEPDAELVKRLAFNNEVITSNNIGRINNSGPRIGLAYMVGVANEFATRDVNRGGLGIYPLVSIIGYQFEAQYVGTENFSALVEFVGALSGLEQGQFIPSIQILNGFRFGKAGWEFAFGPGFSVKKTDEGFMDDQNLFDGGFYNRADWNSYADATYRSDSSYYSSGVFQRPSVEEASNGADGYNFDRRFADARGELQVNFLFVLAAGRTFRAGNLNIPVNVFYSSQRGGGLLGLSVGFNILRKKQTINSNPGAN